MSDEVLQAVQVAARNAELPIEFINKYASGGTLLAAVLGEYPDRGHGMCVELSEEGTKDEKINVRYLIATQTTSPSILEKLAKDSNPWVRGGVFDNKAVPDKIVSDTFAAGEHMEFPHVWNKVNALYRAKHPEEFGESTDPVQKPPRKPSAMRPLRKKSKKKRARS